MAEKNYIPADDQHFNASSDPSKAVRQVDTPKVVPAEADKDLGSPNSGMAEDFEDDTYDIAEDPDEIAEEKEKEEKNIWEKIKDKAEDIGSDIKRAFD